MESWISTILISALAWWLGYVYGQKITNITTHNHYTGDIDKLIINGEVRWVSPKRSDPPTTSAGDE